MKKVFVYLAMFVFVAGTALAGTGAVKDTTKKTVKTEKTHKGGKTTHHKTMKTETKKDTTKKK